MGINASRDTLREEARESLQSDVYVDGGTQPRHLIVFANGLFGSPANWDFMVDSVMRSMKDKQPFAHCVLHKSQENALLRTFDGIDVCGERLAREIRFEVERNPTLKKISLIGHSMGGLIARYAAGKLYDPQTGLIAGLKPMHYVSMATPHLGVAGEEGENSVPFIDWSEVLPKGPQIGKLRPWDLTRFLRDNAAPVTTLALGRTGAQLFLEDGDAADRARQNEPGALAAAMQYRAKLGGWSTGLPPELEMSRAAANACAGDDGAAQGNGRSAREVAGAGPEPPGATNGSRGAGAPKPPPGMERLGAEPDGSTVTLADMPLVYRMAFDVPERREYFISALKAFKSRTCYANVDLDHLVSWPNSSLRASNALPAYDPERLREARGVVHADPLPCAWDGELSRREARAAAEAARRAAPNSAEAVRIAMRGSRYPEVPEGGGFSCGRTRRRRRRVGAVRCWSAQTRWRTRQTAWSWYPPGGVPCR
ncbi:unnamed protein product [Pedinophyceae sp. YPF-701]|nr:unnamed protein product [Pedinophyceae sp. YPF-701]